MRNHSLSFSKLVALSAVTFIASSANAIQIDGFGVNGWYSATTKDSAGNVLTGANYSHGPGGTAADDLKIAQQIQFVDNGHSPSPTGTPTTLSGSTGGALQLYATDQNPGKANITRRDSFGSASALLLGDDFFVNYRQFTIAHPTTRTPGLNIWVTGTNNERYSFSFADPSHSGSFGTWTESNIDSDTKFLLYEGPGAQGGAGPALTMDEWAVDINLGSILFGAGSEVDEFGFTLGTYQRNAYVYIDWVESNIIDAGERNDFVSAPEGGSALALSSIALLALASAKRRFQK